MATERVERRLAAILAADVAGYSRLMGADEESANYTFAVIRNNIESRRNSPKFLACLSSVIR